MNSIENLSAADLRRVATLKDKIISIQDEIAAILKGTTKASSVNVGKRKPMSAAAKAKIAKAAKLRWKKAKAAGKKRL